MKRQSTLLSFKLVRVYFTIPITTATAERSFLVLCRIKTYLPHKDLTSNLDLKEVGQFFIDANSKKTQFFGSFA